MSAAMKAKLATLVQDVASQEEFENITKDLGTKLLVIDVHKKWCGPCEVMRPTFERIFLSLDNPEKMVSFINVNEEADIAALKEFTDQQSCKPLFVLWKNGEVVLHIKGANAPEVSASIQSNLPKLEED
eukprot:g4996.t1